MFDFNNRWQNLGDVKKALELHLTQMKDVRKDLEKTPDLNLFERRCLMLFQANESIIELFVNSIGEESGEVLE